ncbi:SRPBCC family protein [Mycolicibacterium sp. P1-5]|uniref:SRPBCC family protein n=1 Tax=Mycolicibacterium sp. P1-5 TaxID=2024617 RepID=UPI0011EFF0AF|nr:SRPBCC family protein [Mycolicibacterium sp. P1-5]KAA0111156.1 cyclase [Mycolicibacterium sp. P1-5]
MPLVSKTVEVNADADTILRIVADFEAYPDWNPEAKAIYVLARYEDGRPSQLRLDMEIQGQSGTFIQAVYYPGEGQIQTVLQQGEVFTKQDQLFSVVAMGPSSLLTVDLDVEVSLPVPAVMVKKLINDVLEHLANNLKARAEELSG